MAQTNAFAFFYLRLYFQHALCTAALPIWK